MPKKRLAAKKADALTLAAEKIQECADRMKPGDKTYYPPQIQIGGQLIKTSRLLKQAGLIPAEELNYWIAG